MRAAAAATIASPPTAAAAATAAAATAAAATAAAATAADLTTKADPETAPGPDERMPFTFSLTDPTVMFVIVCALVPPMKARDRDSSSLGCPSLCPAQGVIPCPPLPRTTSPSAVRPLPWATIHTHTRTHTHTQPHRAALVPWTSMSPVPLPRTHARPVMSRSHRDCGLRVPVVHMSTPPPSLGDLY